MIKIFQWAILVLPFVMNLAACTPNSSPAQKASSSVAVTVDTEASQFKQDLQNMIQLADNIVVTEHSFMYDLMDDQLNKSLIPDQIIYGTKTLSKVQKLQFLATVNELKSELAGTPSACIFEPHHTVVFLANGKLIGKMEICFGCGQIEWNGTPKNLPQSLYVALAGFIKYIGFVPTQNWMELAKKHKKS